MGVDSAPRCAKATCILNSAAGGTRQDRRKLADLFAQVPAEVHIMEANDSSNVSTIARKAVVENSKLVLTAGGDGTINAVATAGLFLLLVGQVSEMSDLHETYEKYMNKKPPDKFS